MASRKLDWKIDFSRSIQKRATRALCSIHELLYLLERRPHTTERAESLWSCLPATEDVVRAAT